MVSTKPKKKKKVIWATKLTMRCLGFPLRIQLSPRSTKQADVVKG